MKERPPSASVANKDFPLSSKPDNVVYTHYKVQITLLHSCLCYIALVELMHNISGEPEQVVFSCFCLFWSLCDFGPPNVTDFCMFDYHKVSLCKCYPVVLVTRS